MVAIDCNILARYIIKDAPEQAKAAQAIFDAAQPASLLLDRLTLAELSYVLRSVYNFKKPEITLVLQSLLADSRLYVVDAAEADEAVGLFASEQPLSFEDSWLLGLKRLGAVTDVQTFDGALKID